MLCPHCGQTHAETNMITLRTRQRDPVTRERTVTDTQVCIPCAVVVMSPKKA